MDGSILEVANLNRARTQRVKRFSGKAFWGKKKWIGLMGDKGYTAFSGSFKYGGVIFHSKGVYENS